MKPTKFLPILLFLVLLLGAGLACNLTAPAGEPSPDEAVAATVQAVQDQRATEEAKSPPPDVGDQPEEPAAPDESSDPVPPTPTPTNTIVPSPTPTEIPCDRAAFVSDVTIPDGTDFDPGDVFTKTWRLKNTGSCSWTSGYDLVFDHGDQMGAPATVQLTSGTIGQNQNVDVSVQLTAPGSEGNYQGFFKLRNPQGQIFGIGANGNVAFWVEIEVIEPSAPPDLIVADIILDPSTPKKNNPVDVTVRIQNIGGDTGTSFNVEWWSSTTAPNPRNTWTVNGLDEGEVKELEFTYAGYPSWYGSINHQAIVDSDNDVSDESNEGNNIRQENISVDP